MWNQVSAFLGVRLYFWNALYLKIADAFDDASFTELLGPMFRLRNTQGRVTENYRGCCLKRDHRLLRFCITVSFFLRSHQQSFWKNFELFNDTVANCETGSRDCLLEHLWLHFSRRMALPRVFTLPTNPSHIYLSEHYFHQNNDIDDSSNLLKFSQRVSGHLLHSLWENYYYVKIALRKLYRRKIAW